MLREVSSERDGFCGGKVGAAEIQQLITVPTMHCIEILT